jgi:hypothetical protein
MLCTIIREVSSNECRCTVLTVLVVGHLSVERLLALGLRLSGIWIYVDDKNLTMLIIPRTSNRARPCEREVGLSQSQSSIATSRGHPLPAF